MTAATDASTIEATAIARTTMRTESRSTSRGAIDASAQASATIAKAAGAQAVTSGSVDFGDGIGEAGRPAVDRDGAESDRDGKREREVREPEDHRLGREIAQVASDPRGRRDRHRPRDDGGPQHPCPDRCRPPPAARHEGHERTEPAARGGREDRDPRVGQRQGHGRRRQHAERHGGASRRLPTA